MSELKSAIEIYPSAGLAELELHLQRAANAILVQDWLEVVHGCLMYLENSTIAPSANQDGSKRDPQFREFAARLMQANHDYNSILNLFETKVQMTRFVSCYFHQQDKKGVHVPTPVPTREEAIFIFNYCLGLHNLIASRLNDGEQAGN